MSKMLQFTVFLLMIMAVITGCNKQLTTNPVPKETQGYDGLQTITPAGTLPRDQKTKEITPSQEFPTVPIISGLVTETPTFTPTLTNTPTTPATMTAQEAEKTIKQLLLTNGGCKSCFWGIVPGKSTLDETRNFITSMSSLSGYSEQEQNHFVTIFSVKDGLFTVESIFHYNDSLMVDGIQAILGLDKPGVDKTDWLFYNPNSILHTYGVPSKVEIAIGTGPTPLEGKKKTDYSLSLFFDQSDFIIEYAYAEDAIVGPSDYTICPTKDRVTSLEVWYGEYKEHPPVFITEINQLSNLSNEDFYKRITAGSGWECIKIRAAK